MFRFTRERFETAQADKYFDELYDLFRFLAASPRNERPAVAGNHSFRLHPYRSHILTYQEASDGVDILRNVHGRQDVLDVSPFLQE